MEKRYRLNPSVSFREKGGVYVFYFDFTFFFFKDVSAQLVKNLLEVMQTEKGFKELPDNFLEYLVTKGILEEVAT